MYIVPTPLRKIDHKDGFIWNSSKFVEMHISTINNPDTLNELIEKGLIYYSTDLYILSKLQGCPLKLTGIIAFVFFVIFFFNSIKSIFRVLVLISHKTGLAPVADIA